MKNRLKLSTKICLYYKYITSQNSIVTVLDVGIMVRSFKVYCFKQYCLKQKELIIQEKIGMEKFLSMTQAEFLSTKI